jgi:hypothetical protein
MIYVSIYSHMYHTRIFRHLLYRKMCVFHALLWKYGVANHWVYSIYSDMVHKYISMMFHFPRSSE